MAEYIERDALMLHIAGVKIHLKGKGDWMVGYRDALQAVGEMVQKAKAADVVEVKRGRWIDRYHGEYANALYVCSECGGTAHDLNGREWILSNFCPSCGADMREREVTEDG